MSNYRIGDIVKLTRESLGISQEELSFGICSVQTLSRIENGHHKVNKATYQKLMERMGRSGEINYSRIAVDDFDMLDVMLKLNTASSKHEYDQMEEYLNELRGHMDLKENVRNIQYFRRKEINVDYHKED